MRDDHLRRVFADITEDPQPAMLLCRRYHIDPLDITKWKRHDPFAAERGEVFLKREKGAGLTVFRKPTHERKNTHA